MDYPDLTGPTGPPLSHPPPRPPLPLPPDDQALAQALPWLLRGHGVGDLVAPMLAELSACGANQMGHTLPLLQAMGLDVRLHQRALDEIPDDWMPAVLLLHNGDACVLTARGQGSLGEPLCTVVLPGPEDAADSGWSQAVCAPADEIEAEYGGQVLVLHLRGARSPATTTSSTSAGATPLQVRRPGGTALPATPGVPDLHDDALTEPTDLALPTLDALIDGGEVPEAVLDFEAVAPTAQAGHPGHADHRDDLSRPAERSAPLGDPATLQAADAEAEPPPDPAPLGPPPPAAPARAGPGPAAVAEVLTIALRAAPTLGTAPELLELGPLPPAMPLAEATQAFPAGDLRPAMADRTPAPPSLDTNRVLPPAAKVLPEQVPEQEPVPEPAQAPALADLGANPTPSTDDAALAAALAALRRHAATGGQPASVPAPANPPTYLPANAAADAPADEHADTAANTSASTSAKAPADSPPAFTGFSTPAAFSVRAVSGWFSGHSTGGQSGALPGGLSGGLSGTLTALVGRLGTRLARPATRMLATATAALRPAVAAVQRGRATLGAANAGLLAHTAPSGNRRAVPRGAYGHDHEPGFDFDGAEPSSLHGPPGPGPTPVAHAPQAQPHARSPAAPAPRTPPVAMAHRQPKDADAAGEPRSPVPQQRPTHRIQVVPAASDKSGQGRERAAQLPTPSEESS